MLPCESHVFYQLVIVGLRENTFRIFFQSRYSEKRLENLTYSHYSGYQPAYSQSIRPVTLLPCTMVLCCIRSLCVNTMRWSVRSRQANASRITVGVASNKSSIVVKAPLIRELTTSVVGDTAEVLHPSRVSAPQRSPCECIRRHLIYAERYEHVGLAVAVQLSGEPHSRQGVYGCLI